MTEPGNSKVSASARGQSMVLRNRKVTNRFDPRRPRYQLCYDGTRVSKEEICMFAEIALSHFNVGRIQSEAGPKYVLAKELKCIHSLRACCYHFNFIGRPENASDDGDNKLFFAEVKWDRLDTRGYYCSCCCIIGPPGTVMGLNGCNLFCPLNPRHVQHPHPREGWRHN